MPKQGLNHVQSRIGATATRAHVESPLRTKICVDSCSVGHQRNCCASTREIPAACISILTQGTGKFTCDKTAALAHSQHTWIFPCAKRQKVCCVLTPRANLDFFPCANKNVHAKTLLHSHVVSTVGSLFSPCAKKTCTCERTAAFARRKHTWIFFRAQARSHVHATDGCARHQHTWIPRCAQKDIFRRKVRMLRAHLDLFSLSLSLCATQTCSCDGLLRSHARSSTWICLRAQKGIFRQSACCVLTLRAHLDLAPWTPNPVSTVKHAHVP